MGMYLRVLCGHGNGSPRVTTVATGGRVHTRNTVIRVWYSHGFGYRTPYLYPPYLYTPNLRCYPYPCYTLPPTMTHLAAACQIAQHAWSNQHCSGQDHSPQWS